MTTAEGLAGPTRDTAPADHLSAGRARRRRADNLRGWLYCSPFLVAFLLFLIWPTVYGLWMSFTGTSLAGTNTGFVGLANWKESPGTRRCGARWATPPGSRSSRPSPWCWSPCCSPCW